MSQGSLAALHKTCAFRCSRRVQRGTLWLSTPAKALTAAPCSPTMRAPDAPDLCWWLRRQAVATKQTRAVGTGVYGSGPAAALEGAQKTIFAAQVLRETSHQALLDLA